MGTGVGPDRPTGLYEELISESLKRDLEGLSEAGFTAFRAKLDAAEAPGVLAAYLERFLRQALARLPSEERLRRQVELCNEIVQLVSSNGSDEALDPLITPAELLKALVHQGGSAPPRPQTPLDQSALLVNAPREPKLASELSTELRSADRVDLLCSFVMWNGVRALRPSLEYALEKGVPLRVITTTYMGTTEKRALDLLESMGAQIKVSYDSRVTRLHAKAWLFERDTGFSTAYIGSSNLSHSALHEGLEWNVRVSQRSAGDLLDRFRMAFESYWADPHFLPYDAERFLEASHSEGRTNVDFTAFDVRPYPHQEQILERLKVERERHSRNRNLVVAATGTGKTVIAALDYRRLAEEWGGASLLFVAHRKEILTQSLTTFRHVMRDGSFGELQVGDERADRWQHVFASVQGLSREMVESLEPSKFDVVIIDEFHHAAAPTYARLLDHLAPKQLLGLTATPERTDGQDVTVWFGGRIAAELRVWQAIDEGLLCPFQYFGVADEVDLGTVAWRQGGYDLRALSEVYTGNEARVAKVLRALKETVFDVGRMRALGFCVSVEHAKFMAESFQRAGIPSRAVHGGSAPDDREQALRDLRDRRVNVLFAVDLYNEGVDVPEIDTVLFLRPTESATVFLQQLGRGLRTCPGKAGLTVLDFIGQQHRKFRFDLRYRALTGASRADLEKQVENEFPFLPSGCHIQLDRVSREIVLNNIKSALGLRRDRLIAELKSMGEVSLEAFLATNHLRLSDIYRGGGSWTGLKKAAGLPVDPEGPEHASYMRGVSRLLHIDDPERLDLYRRVLQHSEPDDFSRISERHRRLLTMLHFSLRAGAPEASIPDALRRLYEHKAIQEELVEVFDLLDQQADTLPMPSDLPDEIPLLVHERYSRDEVLSAVGQSTISKPTQLREGVRYVKDHLLDLLFVTLKKSDRDFSPTTMYKDYAISPTLFHWESQSTTSEDRETGQRYINHEQTGNKIALFARAERTWDLGTSPYMFLGLVRYVSHSGSRPMSIVWKLDTPLPMDFFEVARAVT
ncbi:MAG TPA: DUF3427 domain-containing protein [Actinomycetota bacterium]|nr:DUF3427 domain-containing protein [Actinomycetota bacterium]